MKHKQFEYTSLSKARIGALNNYGKEGWEVVQVGVVNPDWVDGEVLEALNVLFKREILPTGREVTEC
jgi:Domain of unknown function (DUF4177)